MLPLFSSESLCHVQRRCCRYMGDSSYIQPLPHSLHKIVDTGQLAESQILALPKLVDCLAQARVSPGTFLLYFIPFFIVR